MQFVLYLLAIKTKIKVALTLPFEANVIIKTLLATLFVSQLERLFTLFIVPVTDFTFCALRNVNFPRNISVKPQSGVPILETNFHLDHSL